MSATKASSSRATNTASDTASIFPTLRSGTANTTNNAASDNAASNIPNLPSGTAATAAAEDSQPEDEDEPPKPIKSANIPKVTASQRARQYLRWAEAHPYPVVDKDGGNTPKDDDEDRKTVYALIQQIDPSGQKLQSLASLSEEAPGEKKWPASWDISKFGYLKGMIKKDLARWMRQLVPVEKEDEGEVEVAVSPPATFGTGSAQAEQAVVGELVKQVDGLSVGAEVGPQGGLGLELESPVGAPRVAGGEGGALFDMVGVETAPPPALTSVPSPAARLQANPQQPIIPDAFVGVGVQTAPPPATIVPSSAPEPPSNRQQSIAHNAWLGAGVKAAPAPAPVTVQPSPGAAPTPATPQSVQYDPAWWRWYRQRHAAKRRAEEEEDAEFF
ncbi:hypothetical protein CcaCcLH18_13086 [Colletotrichum camelliae]|nr:hypothetical protein CcaCcLH18_13086 [Colletotrichum camelliae]